MYIQWMVMMLPTAFGGTSNPAGTPNPPAATVQQCDANNNGQMWKLRADWGDQATCSCVCSSTHALARAHTHNPTKPPSFGCTCHWYTRTPGIQLLKPLHGIYI